jgi:hypothetical protein
VHEEELAAFQRVLTEAASHITAPYFQLPDAGLEDPAYRERVYSYELYHQLRKRWPASLSRYSLGGEVDKTGHPLVRGNDLDRVKPDLIVHVPGDMSWNLAVVEIKPALLDRRKIEHDLRKLAAFCDPDRGRYASAFFLVYGTPPDDNIALRHLCESIAWELNTHETPLHLVVQSLPATCPVVHTLHPRDV